MRALILSLIVSALVVLTASAQTPMPIVVPAMTSGNTNTTQSPVTTAATTTAAQTALKALQAMKAANDEILKQQTATLEKLDELEKAANELRIYSKRG